MTKHPKDSNVIPIGKRTSSKKKLTKEAKEKKDRSIALFGKGKQEIPIADILEEPTERERHDQLVEILQGIRSEIRRTNDALNHMIIKAEKDRRAKKGK